MSARFPPRIFRRVPFEAELRIRFEEGGEELVARSANLSLGGMFVVADPPPEPGSTFELSFKLPEQPAPVRGRGRVVWTRAEGEGPDRLPGMGVRFLELTPGSRELIFEVVDRRVRDGSPYDDGGEGEETGSIADRGSGAPPPAARPTAQEPIPPDPPPPPPLPPPEPPPPEPVPVPPSGPVAAASAPAPPLSEAEPSAPEPSAPEPAASTLADADATTSLAGGLSAPRAAAEPPPAPEPPGGEVSVRVMELRQDAGGPGDVLSAEDSAVFAADRSAAAPPLPPVEMPEPERPTYAKVGGAYAGRARGGLRAAWLAGGAVVIVAAVAVAGFLLLGGERVAELLPGRRSPSPPAPAAAAGAQSGGGEAAAGEPAPPTTGEPADAGEEPTGDESPGDDLPPSAIADLNVESGAGASDGAGAAAVRRPAPPPSAPARSAPTPAAEPASSIVGARARRVTRITWSREDGATELVIWGDGVFPPGSYRQSRLGGERPRELIRLVGIEEPFTGGTVDVGTAQVSRVRTGHHLETDPDELHVVVDLATAGATAADLREDGSRLRLRIEGR